MGYLQEYLDQIVTSFTNVFKFDVDPDLTEAENVDKVIGETGLVAGMIACIQPIPALDVFVLAPLHAKMTLQIGKIKGYEVSDERALDIVKEVIGIAWMHLTAQALIGIVGKVIPIARVFLTFPLNYAATWAMGKVVDYYFDCMRAGTIPSAEVMKELFAEQFKIGKLKGKAFDQDEISKRAQALREKVAARDPNLVTRTRMEPRASRSRTPSKSSVAPSPSSVRGKIKITLKDKDEDEDSQHVATPERAAKTIGPDEDESRGVQIGFKPAEKTLGADDAEFTRASQAKADEVEAPEAEAPVEPEEAESEEAAALEETDPQTLQDLLPGVEVTPSGGTPLVIVDDEEPASLIDKLERLASLREQGVLDPEEFEQAKKKLLAGD